MATVWLFLVNPCSAFKNIRGEVGFDSNLHVIPLICRNVFLWAWQAQLKGQHLHLPLHPKRLEFCFSVFLFPWIFLLPLQGWTWRYCLRKPQFLHGDFGWRAKSSHHVRTTWNDVQWIWWVWERFAFSSTLLIVHLIKWIRLSKTGIRSTIRWTGITLWGARGNTICQGSASQVLYFVNHGRSKANKAELTSANFPVTCCRVHFLAVDEHH